MKYDLNQKTNRFAKRTLEAFSTTMFELLTKKSFEDLTVNEICEKSNYPRSTFYNYFDDKYDLLNYCWLLLSKKIGFDDYLNIEPEIRLFEIFDRMYDFFNNNIDKLKAIIHVNTVNGLLIDNFRIYLKLQITNAMNHCPCTQKYTIPYKIIAQHYTNTVMLVLEWSFLRGENLSKDLALKYLKYLLEEI